MVSKSLFIKINLGRIVAILWLGDNVSGSLKRFFSIHQIPTKIAKKTAKMR
ncbi:hypothetical protein [Alysiella filiformis]|uniref:hypothetical protein n=1 Tax=Alysiella filiformis TaxID=194196 RepID=UPI0015F7079E|nr:hypothetical protein [Alysiella filiformis]QMT31287.1 hypothetical protein H3L97_11465 [Alysiella filiformis]UBQ55709.1 hypothetical protein JF568_09005 [Alysiella filiformis DSM 16848]